MITIGIIDVGIGNTHSLISALVRSGYAPSLITSPEEMHTYDWITLPGVGAFPYAMKQLHKHGFVDPLRQWARDGKPLIGICLGMQLLYDIAYEQEATEGLGLLQGAIKLLPSQVKIPHMGWNTLTHQLPLALLNGIPEESAVYFVHSYFATEDDPLTHVSTTTYGKLIPAIVKKGNILGFQFHPEKSGPVGAQLLNQLKEILK